MFSLEFFKGKIDITTIQNQTPPIDTEVVDSINTEIKEENEHESEDENKNDFSLLKQMRLKMSQFLKNKKKL